MSHGSPQPSRRSSRWEGLLLTFFVIVSVLLGIAYVISINTMLPIPWLIILGVAAALTWWLNIGRRRSGGNG